MTAANGTAEKLKVILRRDLRVPADTELGDDTPLVDGAFDLDSLDILLLVTSIEKGFGIRIPDRKVGREAFETVGTLVAFIERQPAAAPAHETAAET